MSLCIVLSTADGIVLAGDSRSSYINNAGIQRIGSDSGFKIFKINNYCGLTTVGTGSLFDKKSQSFKNIKWLINEFLENENIDDKTSILKIAEKLQSFFQTKHYAHIDVLKEFTESDLKKRGFKNISFEKPKNLNVLDVKYTDKNNKEQIHKNIISSGVEILLAGYEKKKSIGYKLEFLMDSPSCNPLIFPSLNWSGQGNFLARMIQGIDVRALHMLDPILNHLDNREKLNMYSNITKSLTCNIKYEFMPLQDGIELAKLLIETTSNLQKFSDGVYGDSGGEGHAVGGVVDIAVITPFLEGKSQFKWIAKKEVGFQGT